MNQQQAEALEAARSAMSKLIYLYPDLLKTSQFIASSFAEMLDIQSSHQMIKYNMGETHNNS